MSKALIVSGYLTHGRSLMQDIDRINRTLRNGDKIECVEAGYDLRAMQLAAEQLNYDVALVGPLNEDKSGAHGLKTGNLLLSYDVWIDDVISGILPFVRRKGLSAVVLSATDLAAHDRKSGECAELALIEAGAHSVIPWQFTHGQLNDAINSALASNFRRR